MLLADPCLRAVAGQPLHAHNAASRGHKAPGPPTGREGFRSSRLRGPEPCPPGSSPLLPHPHSTPREERTGPTSGGLKAWVSKLSKHWGPRTWRRNSTRTHAPFPPTHTQRRRAIHGDTKPHETHLQEPRHPASLRSSETQGRQAGTGDLETLVRIHTQDRAPRRRTGAGTQRRRGTAKQQTHKAVPTPGCGQARTHECTRVADARSPSSQSLEDAESQGAPSHTARCRAPRSRASRRAQAHTDTHRHAHRYWGGAGASNPPQSWGPLPHRGPLLTHPPAGFQSDPPSRLQRGQGTRLPCPPPPPRSAPLLRSGRGRGRPAQRLPGVNPRLPGGGIRLPAPGLIISHWWAPGDAPPYPAPQLAQRASGTVSCLQPNAVGSRARRGCQAPWAPAARLLGCRGPRCPCLPGRCFLGSSRQGYSPACRPSYIAANALS